MQPAAAQQLMGMKTVVDTLSKRAVRVLPCSATEKMEFDSDSQETEQDTYSEDKREIYE